MTRTDCRRLLPSWRRRPLGRFRLRPLRQPRRSPHRQAPLRGPRGQATVELLIGALATVPLLLALLALGRLLDLQAAAGQASRLAAFAHALVPPAGEPGAPVEALARSAFDDAQGHRGPGSAGRRPDRAPPARPASFWRDAAGRPLTAPEALRVELSTVDPGRGALRALDAAGRPFGFAALRLGRARIELELPWPPELGPAAPSRLALEASAIVPGHPAAAAGAAEVRARIERARGAAAGSVGRLAGGLATAAGNAAVGLLESVPPPRWGCVAPDVVPADRLSHPRPAAPCGS